MLIHKKNKMHLSNIYAAELIESNVDPILTVAAFYEFCYFRSRSNRFE